METAATTTPETAPAPEIPVEADRPKLRVAWYRCPVPRENLKSLNQRSDLKGFLQTGGYLGLLALTGTSACLLAGRIAWPWIVAIIFFHGMCWAFLINGFHELVHDSVFKTKALNSFFLRILSFLGWHNHHLFWASHTEHHKYTLHPPDDLEVTLPVKLTLANFIKYGFISPHLFYYSMEITIRLVRGKLKGPWENALFPASDPAKRRRLFNWTRIVVAGHTTIIVVSVIMHWWLVPVVVTFAPFYGGWLQWLCNNTQHSGLADNVSDYRVCCRTITLNPFFRFLYWNMNYHTEHHMYAAVPCYNLHKLHKLIKDDLPYCPNGLIPAWRQIATIMKKQKADPTYQYIPDLPPPKARIPMQPTQLAGSLPTEAANPAT